ncbi:hypothetical protein DYBT9623_00484 [Dyadobacter sp. CECT 9623]|uniref:DUF4249 domain-containing protein n=1 Tax=Dyadobacter linearis TaxID=2823330 RepID=A0ABM8UKG4_9BACT|nr:DUF4249 domain-containing protein [Dyadobacter sp. CECT 9623]CAG5067761.1 hypothetical protein DYBT9623_00484 [Dyadobacter sp. CECT 9623]
MNTLKTISCIVLLTIYLTSCESLVTDIPPSKLPQIESKLVINSIISPQLPFINVIVSESAPMFNGAGAVEKSLDNATVLISDGINEMQIPYDSANKIYSLPQSQFPIVPSKKYVLTVSDGKRNVSAECTVPGKVPVIKSYAFDTLLILSSIYQNIDPLNKDSAITLNIAWQDIPSDTNNYKVHALIDFDYNVAAPKLNGVFVEKRIVVQHKFNWRWRTEKNEILSDNHLNGAILNSPVGKVNLPQQSERTNKDGSKVIVYPNTKIKEVLMSVFNIDINYYKYQRSLEIRNSSDNPFAEPTLVYTNVKGGLGCFGAYNAAQIKLTDPK